MRITQRTSSEQVEQHELPSWLLAIRIEPLASDAHAVDLLQGHLKVVEVGLAQRPAVRQDQAL